MLRIASKRITMDASWPTRTTISFEKLSQLIGTCPMANAIGPALSRSIAEHGLSRNKPAVPLRQIAVLDRVAMTPNPATISRLRKFGPPCAVPAVIIPNMDRRSVDDAG